MRVQVVPQWQGAGPDGAEVRLRGNAALASLAETVLDAPVSRVPVGDAPSPTERGIGNRAALLANAATHRTALEQAEGPVLTLGGDCASDLTPVALARLRHGPTLGVLWFDAHADANTPDASPSGAFNGMVLRALLGAGDPDLVANPAVSPGNAVLVGTRFFDPAERAAVDRGLLRHVPVPADPLDVLAALRRAEVDAVYVHVDADVLDPGGLTVERVVACLDALADVDVVGAAVTECTATDARDAEPLAPVLRALARLLSH
jgi:arginase